MKLRSSSGMVKRSNPILSSGSESEDGANAKCGFSVNENSNLNTSETEFLNGEKISDESSNIENEEDEEEKNEIEEIDDDEDDGKDGNNDNDIYTASKLTFRQKQLLNLKTDEQSFLAISLETKLSNTDYSEDLKSEELRTKKALQRKISKERKIEEARKVALGKLLTKKQRPLDSLESNNRFENKQQQQSYTGPVPEGAIRFYDSLNITLATYPSL